MRESRGKPSGIPGILVCGEDSAFLFPDADSTKSSDICPSRISYLFCEDSGAHAFRIVGKGEHHFAYNNRVPVLQSALKIELFYHIRFRSRATVLFDFSVPV